MKLTLVIMEMIMGKEVNVKVDWEVDEVGEDVLIFRMKKNVFLNSLKTKSRTGESADKCKSCSKVFSCSKSLEVHLVTGLATQCKA